MSQRESRAVPGPSSATHPTSDGISSLSLSFVEQRYSDWLRDPLSVSDQWRAYFDGFNSRSADEGPVEAPWGPRAMFQPARTNGGPPAAGKSLAAAQQQERLDQLVRSYRARGHIMARVDPLGGERLEPSELNPDFYGFTEEDMDRTFSTSWIGGPEVRTLREILAWLRNTYCRYIGAQFMHIDSLHARRWLQERMETTENRTQLSRNEQLRILSRLTDAVIFEEFVQKKYVGAKSFSLEGGESLIPLLDMAIEKAGQDGIEEIVLGMAHRGRLNVLANILGKNPSEIFREFDDVDPERHIGRGDVKYHLGYSSDWMTTTGRRVHVTLCFNPSHLEFVNTVALGRCRAKQDRRHEENGERTMCLLIHGDAAFIGEGIVQETLNLSQLTGYSTGGTIHVVVNNQLGFTTPPSEGRSCLYATDVAKMLQIPIFHVNGEDPEAVAQVIKLALDFRHRFHRDVVIDMYCYRRRGHNEGDEPSFTQPEMYRAIAKRPDVREGYLEHLLELGGVSREDADRIVEERKRQLDQELARARSEQYQHRVEMLGGVWIGYRGGPWAESEVTETAVDKARLESLLLAQTKLPSSFHPHPKIRRFLDARQEMARGERPLDWGAGEALALASLVTESVRVRLSGQDSGRGTFSHRHAVLYDHQSGAPYLPLRNLSDSQAPVDIINSPLSEAGVLGFDYGYSLECPDGLVMWEAQFGDFCNAAQVIVDQFIASAEDKWSRLSGLVMLLPHGFEGQGPEHSSARLERFLMLATEDNIQVVYPTTPGQYFHLLRRQMLCRWRKPLIVMTPKSLLRHPRAVSSFEELASGRFQNVIADTNADARRVLICSGKIYYELEERREEMQREDVSIVRLEQIYPFPLAELQQALEEVPPTTPLVWVQEEPENMGAWRFFRQQYEMFLTRWPLAGVCRPASSSPATGSAHSHRLEQAAILEAALKDDYLRKHPPLRFGPLVTETTTRFTDARALSEEQPS